MASIEKHGPDLFLLTVRGDRYGGNDYAEEATRAAALALLADLVTVLAPTQDEIVSMARRARPKARIGYAPAVAELVIHSESLAVGLAQMAYIAGTGVGEFVRDAVESSQEVLESLQDGLEFAREH